MKFTSIGKKYKYFSFWKRVTRREEKATYIFARSENVLPVKRETSTRFACSESLLLSNVQNNFIEVRRLWIIGSALEAKRLESHALFVS